MSIQAINWALEQPGSPTQKHVLLVLANYANESGIAFPSNVLIASKTGLTDRAVRNAKNALLERGLIEREDTYGRGSVRLRLECSIPEKVEPRSINQEARSDKPEPRSTSTNPEPRSAQPEYKDHKKERGSGPYNHQLTTNNHHTPYSPPKASKPRSKPKQDFDLPDWIPTEAWNGWLEMRRSMKKPATPRAMEIAVKRLAAFKAQGHDPSDILETSTLNNWQGLFAPKNQRPHGQQAAPRMSESERNRNIIFEEMRAQYRSQDHANSDRIIFQ